jgi:hypothetical protein
VCLAVVYIAFILPMEISFWSNNLTAGIEIKKQWLVVKVFSWIITFIFLIDITLELKTAFNDEITGELITDRRRILVRYARRPLGLGFDIVTSFPFTEILEPFFDQSTGQGVQSTLRILNALKILRLVRIVRLLRYMDRHLNVNKGIISMIKVSGTLLC